MEIQRATARGALGCENGENAAEVVVEACVLACRCDSALGGGVAVHAEDVAEAVGRVDVRADARGLSAGGDPLGG